MSEKMRVPPPETTPNWVAGVRRRMPFYILLAILLAALAGGLTYRYLERLEDESVPTGQAVVSLQEIRPGTEIQESMVEVREVPEAQLPEGAITKLSEVVGRVAVFPIYPGEVMIKSRLLGGPEESLSSRIPEGHWAMVLPGGWLITPVPELKTGDRIDLLAYWKGATDKEIGPIVTAVEVLAFSGSPQNPGSLTLAVELEEAKSILYHHINGFVLLPLLRPEGS